MRTTTILLAAFLLSLHRPAFSEPAGQEGLPPELKQFLAKDESLLAHESADLNGDGLRDFVFIVETMRKMSSVQAEDDGQRTLKIAIRSSSGSLKVVKASTRTVLCRSCGGVFGDPFAGLSASNKTFSVQHYGGSNWRWTIDYTFNYSKRDNTWQLVRVDESSFHTSEPDKQKVKTYRPPRHFGKIDVAEFDPEKFKGVGAK